MSDYDLVIRNGVIIDGSGNAGFKADVAVQAGLIVGVGEIAGVGAEEIDAEGRLVTPGFVDIHTHYDGQATWEHRMAPSSAHGVTTVLTGNCGVGFAPCRAEHRQSLVELMEGVEDVPEVVMTEGLSWRWQSFPDYLDFLGGRQFDVDIATQLPHSCLRVYVMGERGVRREQATENDLKEMRRLTREAIEAGALGVGTSRSMFHNFPDGRPVPTKDAGEAELASLAAGVNDAGGGVLQGLLDLNRLETEFPLLQRVASGAGLPASFTLAQTVMEPEVWRRALSLLDEANACGTQMRGQIIARPTGILLGLDLTVNPFSRHPGFQQFAGLPLAEKVAHLRKPEIRAAILAESPADWDHPVQKFASLFEKMYPLGDPPNYEPDPEMSVAGRAIAGGVSPKEIAYDLLLEDDGHAVLFVAVANYVDGNLDSALELARHPHTILGLGDGGAHYGLICDAGYPTFMLTYWTRDRSTGERMSVPEVVKALSHDTASAVGLSDRGLIAPGYKADLNIIDYDRLHVHAPRVKYDLPAGGRRITQAASGYAVTIVSGIVTYRDGEPTGALPGRLVRGPTERVSARWPTMSGA